MIAVLASDDSRRVLTWIGFSLGYVVNIASVHEQGIPVDSLQHMWSLAQEEQFYRVWPALLFLALWSGVRGRTLALALGVAGSVVIVYRAYLLASDATLGYAWYAPHLRTDGLILG